MAQANPEYRYYKQLAGTWKTTDDACVVTLTDTVGINVSYGGAVFEGYYGVNPVNPLMAPNQPGPMSMNLMGFSGMPGFSGAHGSMGSAGDMGGMTYQRHPGEDIQIKLGNSFLKNGDEPEKPDRELMRIGYEKKDMAILPGQFARRGGILDIYPVNAQNPVRIEFWGDEIDSIRVFDADSQRSIEKLSKVEIFPATEYILDEEQIEKGLKKIRKDVEARLDELGDNEKRKTPETYEACNRLRKAITDLERIGDYEKYISYFEKNCVSFTDYFPPEKTLVIFDEPAVLEEGYRIQEEEYRESTSYRFEKGYILKVRYNTL